MAKPMDKENKHCPTTGAHFKFADLCLTLMKLDRFEGIRGGTADSRARETLNETRDLVEESLLPTSLLDHLSLTQQKYKGRNDKLLE